MLLPNRIGPTQVTYRPARDILTKTSGFIKAYDFTLNRLCTKNRNCHQRYVG